jgi:hypothetical protein
VITTAQYTLTSGVRQLIVGRSINPQYVCIHNHEHNQNHEIFVGNASVTTSTGIHAVATQTSSLPLEPGDELYAITGQASAEIHVLISSKN